MDLHFTPDEPTPDEREAIDGFLASLAGTAAGQSLLPVPNPIQGRVGWISQGALNHACRRLEVPPAEAFGVADFYALLQTRPQPPAAVHVCDDIGCRFRGGEALCAELEQAIGP